MCVRHETDIPCRCCCCRCSAAEMTSTVCVYTREQRCCKAIRKRNKFSLVRASARAAQRSHAHIRDFKSMRTHARTIFPCAQNGRAWARGKNTRTRRAEFWSRCRHPAGKPCSLQQRGGIFMVVEEGARNSHKCAQFAIRRSAHARTQRVYILFDDGAERERERAEGGCGIFMRPFHPRCPAPGVCH